MSDKCYLSNAFFFWDDDEKISVTSEPIVSMNSPKVCRRTRAGSEGASPGSATASSQEDEDDEDDDEAVNSYSEINVV